MTITYPINTPTDIGIASIKLSAVNAVSLTSSPFSYKQQVHVHSGKMWQASVSIPPVLRDLAEPWVGFLLSLKGRQGTFYLGDPNCTEPRGAAKDYSDTLTIGTEASPGDSSLTISGPTTATGYFLSGDYIQVGNQLFKVLASSDSAASSVTVDVWPDVRATISVGTSVVTSNTKGLFRLQENVSEWSIDNTSVYGISFNAMEVV